MNWIVMTLLAIFTATPAWAVETLSSGNTIYQTTQPTSAQVPNWNTGWPTSGTTGWNYVGLVAGASGVYLGNGWVITAGHVGVGTLTLNGVIYQPIPSSAHNLTYKDSDGTYTSDLTLFQISTSPTLSPLTISQSAPTPFAQGQAGSSVVLIGYGGSYPNENWGYDTIDFINQLITPSGNTYVSNDFITAYGTYTSGTASSTNNSNLVSGDSGGGDFIYNTVTKKWELAGINEVTGTGTFNNQTLTISGYVQLSSYASQINSLVNLPGNDSPTLPLPGLLFLACLLFFIASRALATRTPQNSCPK